MTTIVRTPENGSRKCQNLALTVLIVPWRFVICRINYESQAAPVPHLAHPAGCAALRIVLVTVPCVRRSCDHFPDGFDLHLLQLCYIRWRAEGGRTSLTILPE